MRRKQKLDLRLDYRNGFLCVLIDKAVPIVTVAGPVRSRKWFPIREAEAEEVVGLVGRSLSIVDEAAGLYLDDSGEPYRLALEGKTEAMGVEIIRPDRVKRAKENGVIEVEAVASSNGRPALTYQGEETPTAVEEPELREAVSQNGTAIEGGAIEPEMSAVHERKALTAVAHPLSLKQKLAEVRRRIGQIEKRGVNEEGNYKYVRAADLAGAVGDVLAELGVILLPRLESISTEPLGNRTGADHLTRVVIAYTFIDADSGEELTVKMAGEGLDAGDKGVCKAQTSALKYTLLQSFLIATGDDPEEDSLNRPEREQRITAAQALEVEHLIRQTGTELDRVLEYFEIASVEEMTEQSHRKAMSFLRRKLAKSNGQAAQAA
jgi:hypothetical protein